MSKRRIRSDFKGLMIGTPAFGGEVCTEYMISMNGLINTFAMRGLVGRVEIIAGCSLVHRARNIIVAKFLADPAFSHLLFIDADVEFTPNDVLRLLTHDHDIVGGCYPKKQEPLQYTANLLVTGLDNRVFECPDCGCIEVKALPGGFLLASRDALERMIAVYPDLKYAGGPDETAYEEHLYGLFYPSIRTGIDWGEDYTFCQRWLDLTGTRLWLDPHICLNHVGRKTYRGDPAKMFARVPPPEVNRVVEFKAAEAAEGA